MKHDVVYNAAQTLWTGSLTVGDKSFSGSASGLFTLLSKLDRQYRQSLPPAPPAELMLDKAPSMLPISRLVFPDSDAEADEFYSAACTALAHGVGTCRALLHNGRPVCTVGCYEQSDTESYMAAGVTDPAWQGRGLARYLIVGLANELAAERAVRFACFPALCGFYAQLGFLQIGKIQHYTTDWNTT